MRNYTCGTCGGPHPMERCPTTYPLKWCKICQKMTHHETRNCYYRPKTKQEGREEQARTIERPRPILGAQPPLLGTTAIRLAEVKEFDTPNQFVPLVPYYDEGYYTKGIYESDTIQPVIIMGA